MCTCWGIVTTIFLAIKIKIPVIIERGRIITSNVMNALMFALHLKVIEIIHVANTR